MACRQLINFPAIYQDGQLLSCATDVLIDGATTKVIGEKQEKAWDSVNWKFMTVTGFFISFNGIEYGSVDMNRTGYFTALREACGGGGGGDDFQIHVHEFVREFV